MKKSQKKAALLPKRGVKVTSKTVRKIQEDIDRVDAAGAKGPFKSQYHQDPNPVVNVDLNMTTYSGLYINPRTMTAADVRLQDIAQGLSNMCRFSGQCTEFYSVAQHSFLCSWAVYHEMKGQPGDKEMALTALLHDAPEAYISDLVHCVKRGFPDYYKLEAHIWTCIVEKFNLSRMYGTELPPKVKEVDGRMLVTERMHIISEKSQVWACQQKFKPYNLVVKPVPPHRAKAIFLDAFEAFSGLSPDTL